MKPVRLFPIVATVIVLAFVTMACGGIAAATPTPLPTDTPTLPPTATARPTSTPKPTSTPNLAATEQFKTWEGEIQQFADKGYVDMTAGEFKGYDDFTEEWAQLNWYRWWPIEKISSDFMFGAHLKWSSASSTPEVSGCGIVFGIQGNDDHYSVFIDKGRIAFMMSRGSHVYWVGKTRGSGRTNFGNPAETDLQVLVEGQNAHVSVDGEVTDYTLSMDQPTSGDFALSVLSGTNKEYGTRCEMTNIHMWTPE